MKWIKNKKMLETKKADKFVIPDIIWKLNEIFNKNGFKLYIVGGAIRDFLTKDIPKDYDLSTDALPEDVIKMLKPFFRVQLQGKAFGVTVVFPDEIPEGIQIATFRIDTTKGRKPEVKLGVTIEDDVNRRDLTINSMFFDLETKEIIDITGGKSDLENKIIKMVGDPDERIKEDPLRILRIFRFASRYGSEIDEKTFSAIKNNNDISEISFERIWDKDNGEFFKSFRQAIDFRQYLEFISTFNLWEQILPNMDINIDITNDKNIEIVLAQIVKNNCPKKIVKIFNKVSITSSITNCVSFLVSLKEFKSKDVMKFFNEKKRYAISDEIIERFIKVENITNDSKFLTKFQPTITAKDVMSEFNMKPGPELGKKLRILNTEEFENQFK